MDENELMVVSCPSCGQRFRVRQQSAGRAVKCPHCGQTVNVPLAAGSQGQAAAPAPAAPSQPAAPVQPPAPAQPLPQQPSTSQPAAGAAPTPAPSAPAPAFAVAPAGRTSSQQPIFDPASFPQPSQPTAKTETSQTEPQQEAANPFQAPAFDVASTTASGLPARRRYPALQIIRALYLVMACLVVLGWVLYMAVTLVFAARAGAVGAWFLVSLIPTASAAVTATLLVAIAEGIKLALDIQSNTLTTARNTSNRPD